MSSSLVRYFLMGCVAAAPWPASGQFEPERKYAEVLDPPTPVSGHAVVGVVVLPTPGALQSDKLWVRAAAAHRHPRIRVDVVSANGRLQGEGVWNFRVKDVEQQDWYALDVPPKSKRPERTDHLATAVQPYSSNAGSVPVFLLAQWGTAQPSDQTARIRLYVNSRRAEMFAYLPDGKTQVRCAPVDQTATVRFDAVCDLDLSTILAARSPARLTLVRRDGGSTSRQPLDLHW
jgi:hypothetical protein